MPTLNDLQAKIDQLNNEVSFIVLAISEKIKEFPDNPNIERLNCEPIMFTMDFSEIQKHKTKSFSPHDYDHKWQYERFIEFLVENPNAYGIQRINEIVNRGYFYFRNNKISSVVTNKCYLGNEVIQNLKSIL